MICKDFKPCEPTLDLCPICGEMTLFAKIILTALFAYLGWTAIDYFSRGDIIGGILGSVFSIIVGLVILVVSLSYAKGGKEGKEP